MEPDHAMRRSSVDSASTVSIEPLRDPDEEPLRNDGHGDGGGITPRRRSSNISFEKGASLVMEQWMSLIEDDEDEDSLDGILTAKEAPEIVEAGNPNEASAENCLHTGGGDGHSSESSFDLSRIPAAVRSFSGQGGSSRSVPGRGNGSSSSRLCVLAQIQDEIIEKGVRAGKLVFDADDDEEEPRREGRRMGEEDLAAGGHDSLASFASAASGRSRRRASFARRGSLGSVACFHSRSSSSRWASFRAGPDAALRQLAAEDLAGCYDSDSDDDHNEGNEDASVARAALATGGAVSRRGMLGVIVEVEMASPPPRGTMPRRSSMKKRPEGRRDWTSNNRRGLSSGAA